MTAEFWVIFSFVLFIALSFIPAKRGLLAMIDNRIADAQKDLRDATKLRIEAEKELKIAHDEMIEFESNRKEIMRLTQERVDRLFEDAMNRAHTLQEKRFDMLKQSIEYQANQEIKKVKSEILNLAIAGAASELRNHAVKLDNIQLFNAQKVNIERFAS